MVISYQGCYVVEEFGLVGQGKGFFDIIVIENGLLYRILLDIGDYIIKSTVKTRKY